MKTLPAALVLLAALPAEAGEIRGRLVLDDKPASGVTVSAVSYESPMDEARRDARRQPAPRPLATATSAADGSFSLVVPPDASSQGFRLLMTGGGAAPTQAGGVYDASESTDIGDQTLPRAAKLAGRVVDPKNQPVPGAEVRLTVGSGAIGPFANAADASSVGRTTLTGADGVFRFDEARQQNNRIAVEARGYATAEATGLREGAVPRSITLGPGYALAGVVRGPDRKPAAGALLRFEGKADSRWIETGPDGSFRLADLPAGNGALIVDGGDRGLAEVRGLTLPDSASQKLQIVLAPGAAIEGRVVDAKTGNPLPRVKVLVRSGERVSIARSGSDGRYKVANLLPQRYRVEADDARYVPYERAGIVVLSGATEKVDLPLTAGATLSGRVVDEDGAPVAGARGRLQPSGEGSLAGFLRGMRGGDRSSFRSGPDGVFKATRLAPGENQSLTVSHPRYEARTLGGLTLPPGGTKGGVTVVLSRGLALAGVVKDGEGNPVSGVELQLIQARSFRGGRGGMNLQVNLVAGPESWPRATSGSDGRFQFQGLSKGDYTLTARKPGLSDAILDPAKVADGAEPVELVMNAGASISGVVLDTNGNPAEGYFVQVRAKAGADSPLRGGGPRNATGPDGFFFADGLRAGDAYDLIVMGPDGPGPRQDGVTAPADGLALSVPSRGRISGRVVDAGSGQAVTDFEISLSPDRTTRGGGMVIRMAGPGGRRGRGQGEREQIHADDGSFVLDEVAQGAWEVDVTAKSYQNGRVGGITLEAGQSKDSVLVKLSRGSAIRGRVIDARSGRGIPDARVNAEVVGGQMRPPMLAMLQGGGGLASDADGMFEIDGLSQGRYTVTAEHPDFSEASQLVEVKEGLAAIEIRLAGGSSLGGVVLSDARRPLAGASVALEPSGEGGFGRRAMLGDAQAAVTDDQGRFRFDHLTAGRYRVIAAVRDRSSSPVDTVVQAGESRDDLQLQLQAGATIRGQVTGLLDTERTNVNVTATGPESYFASTRTSSDGRFELSGAPAGTLTLRANAGDFLSGAMRSASANVVVPEGQPEASAEIVFENGFSISGSVTRAGKPIADATVMANMRGAGSSSMARTDSSGAYHLEGLRAGTYNLNTFSSQGSGRPQEVKLDGDATVDIVIPVARIAGSVVEATSKQPLADASVDVSATSGGGGAGGMLRLGGATDSNGRFSFEDLEPKDYTVTARRAGFQFEKTTVAASESGASDEIVIELQRGEGIGVVAKDGIFGIPLRGLMARVTDAGNAPVFSGPVSLDSEGRGEIPSVRPGSYTVILDASGYAPVTLAVSVPSASLNVLMTPGGSIEFRAGEVTRAAGSVNLTITDDAGRRAVWSLFGPPGSVVFSGANHLVENVPPGRYTVTPKDGAAQSFTVAEGGRTVVDLP